MQNRELDIISIVKFEKQIQVLVAFCLSIVLFLLIFVLIKVSMTSELQQVLIVVLGLITVSTLDAFRKAISNTSSSLINEFKQIIVQDGASYISGNVDAIHKPIRVEGNYVTRGSINYGNEKRQTLAESAAEIQDLLQQLEKSNPAASEAEIVAYVNEEIEPDLKSRLVNALKVGGEAAIENSLDSHYVSLIRALIKGWAVSE
jgi:hypothetical protein